MAGLPNPLIMRIIRQATILAAEDRFEEEWDWREGEKMKFEDALHTIEILAEAFTDMDDKDGDDPDYRAEGNGILFLRNYRPQTPMGNFEDLFGNINDGRFPKSLWYEIMGPHGNSEINASGGTILEIWLAEQSEDLDRYVWGWSSFRSHRAMCRRGHIWTSTAYLDYIPK